MMGGGGGGDKGPGHQRALANGLKMQSEREVRASLETEQLLTSKFPRKHRTRRTQLTLLTKQPNTACVRSCGQDDTHTAPPTGPPRSAPPAAQRTPAVSWGWKPSPLSDGTSLASWHARPENKAWGKGLGGLAVKLDQNKTCAWIHSSHPAPVFITYTCLLV